MIATVIFDISMQGASVYIIGVVTGWLLCYAVEKWVGK